MRYFPVKPSLVILTLLVLMRVPDAMPAFKDYRVLDWHSIPAVLDFAPRKSSLQPVADEQARLRPDTDPASFKIYRLNDPRHALDTFFEALQRTEARKDGTITRILHYGDSPTTADLITGDTRRLLQKQFGDAGHGFCLMAKPWAWYEHNGVSLQGSGWEIEPSTQGKMRDGAYGLGGVSFRGEAGARTAIIHREANHTRLEVAYQQQPGGGSFAVLAEGKTLGTVSTAGHPTAPGFAEFSIPEGVRHFEVRVTSGSVRAFGVDFTRKAPGVQYDSLGLNGAYVSVLAKMFNADHWADQLRHAKPDLVIINYGTNESVYAAFVDNSYGKELREIVRRVRAALPQTSILLMSPMDRGKREAGGEIGTVPTIPRLVGIQQTIAGEMSCGFFNTYLAMGGPGTMGRWYEAEPRLVGGDFIHPMPGGAKIVGNLLYQALFDAYNQYKVRRMQERLAKVSGKP